MDILTDVSQRLLLTEEEFIRAFNCTDERNRDVEIKILANSSVSEMSDNEDLKAVSIRFNTIDANEKRVTKTTFSVADLIGASIKSHQDHLIEISVLPLDLRTACGRKTNNPTKRNLYSFEYCAGTSANAINIVGTLNDLALGRKIQNEYEELPPKRKLLIFLNPFSCAGRAARVWRRARIILDKAYINQYFIETERAGHAYTFVHTEDLDEFEGIVSVSGDGLIHEIINGLLNRKDNYYHKRKIPLGVIPGGSADGLAKALLEKSGEKFGLEQACLLIIKGHTRLMDITKIVSASKPDPIYSFLAVAWCIISDVDLESEKVRWMGDTRFTLWAVLRVLKLRRYQAVFSYKGNDITEKGQTAKDIGVDQLTSSHFNKISKDEEDIEELKSECISEKANGTYDHISLMEPVPKDWKSINSSFNYLLISNTAFMGKNFKCSPCAEIDDGCSDLVVQEGTHGTCKILKLMLNIEKGTYFNRSNKIKHSLRISYKKITEWRLCPNTNFLDKDEDGNVIADQTFGFYSIDGEKYDTSEIHGKVLHKFLNVMCL